MHSPLTWASAFAATVLVLSACGGSTSADTATHPSAAPTSPAASGAGEDEDESTADLAEHHRHHHHGGFAMFIAMSLDTIGTTPEQAQAIGQVQADMFRALEPAHDAERAVLEQLADAVASGKVDRAKTDEGIARVAAAARETQGAIADSLNRLHAALTPPQRAALVGKLGAHYEVWHHVNADEDHNRIARLADQLGLTAAQTEKIRADYDAALRDVPPFARDHAEQYLQTFGGAFTNDSFDAASLGAGGDVNAELAMWGLTRLARLYEAAAPTLTTPQAARLADIIRAHAHYQHSQGGTP